MFGEEGKDHVYGNEGNDWLDGGGDNDKLWGGQGDDSIKGGAGNDHLNGGEGVNLLDGDEGWNKLWNGTEFDFERSPPPPEYEWVEYSTFIQSEGGCFASLVYTSDGTEERLVVDVGSSFLFASLDLVIDGVEWGTVTIDENGSGQLVFSTVVDGRRRAGIRRYAHRRCAGQRRAAAPGLPEPVGSVVPHLQRYILSRPIRRMGLLCCCSAARRCPARGGPAGPGRRRRFCCGQCYREPARSSRRLHPQRLAVIGVDGHPAGTRRQRLGSAETRRA